MASVNKIQPNPSNAPPSSPPPNLKKQTSAAADLHTRIQRMSLMENNHSPLYLFLEEPGSSAHAHHFANFMTVVVVVSIVGFCLETENGLKESCNYMCWLVIDWIFVAIFTIEFGLRNYLYCLEGRNKEFWKDPLNVVDFIAILPSYIELVQWISLDFPQYGPPEELFLKLMKLAKCTRVFKLMKHFAGTEVLIKSIKEAMEALYIPFFFLGIMVLIFASIMYFMEGQIGELNEVDGHYYSGGEAMTYRNIPHTMYFMMVTMTTTGYGDQYPSSTFGKILASVAAVFGILFLAMPLTIVGNSFYNNWNKFLAKKEAEEKVKQIMLRRTEFKRKSLLQNDLRRNVDKLVVAANEPGPPSKRLDGTQRDILGSYLSLMHLSSVVRDGINKLLAISKSTEENEEKVKEAKDAAVAADDTQALEQLEYDADVKDHEIRNLLKTIKDNMLDMSVSAAVFGSVLGKGTKTKGRKGSLRLLKDVSRRVLVQVKMRKWASVYGRGEGVGEACGIAEQHKRGWKDHAYLLLEFPESSVWAQRISTFSIIVIMLSILSFMLESVPELHTYGGSGGIPESGWFVIECIFTFLFSLEFVLRLIVAPKKWTFWTDALNWCDFVAIVPFYFEVLLALGAGTEPWNFQVNEENVKVALRVVKLFRVLRVFKMTRQFPASRLIADTMIFSADALMVPMFFLLVFVLIFASMLFFLEGGQWIDPAGQPCEYFCEGGTYVYSDSGDANPHLSIFTCFWVMIITITTVGYGDIYPTTTMGRLVSIFAMIFGIIYTAMPLAIVGSFFFDAYDKQKKAMSTPDDLAKAVRTKIPKEAEPSIMCYLDGSKESENLSAKQIIVKLKEDFAIICGDPKPVKKKKLFGGGLFGALKQKTDVKTSDETSTTETKEASKNSTPIDDSMTSSQSGNTSTVSALPTEPVAVLPKPPSLQTGDAVNGGSRYAAPTPIKKGDEPRKGKATKPKYNLLPLVLKRMLRRLGHQQVQYVALGRVVHYMVAERISSSASSHSMMQH